MVYVADHHIDLLNSEKLFTEGVNSIFSFKQCTYDDLRAMTFQVDEARAVVAVLEGIEAFPRNISICTLNTQGVQDETNLEPQTEISNAEGLPQQHQRSYGFGMADTPAAHLDSEADETENESQAMF